jgi:chromatin remodeling complex protein RSC6
MGKPTTTTTTAKSSPASVSASAAKTSKSKVSKVVKKQPTAEVEETSTPAVETSAPVEATNEVVESVSTDMTSVLETRFAALGAKLSQMSNDIGAIKKEYAEVGRLMSKEMKISRKLSEAKMKRAGNRAPAGFIKPTLIGDELAKFLGAPIGTEMARTAVTKQITKYVKSNDLQDPTNGRTIIPDAALAKLLKISKNDELTYFNLQRYLAPHFPSSTANTAAAAAV